MAQSNVPFLDSTSATRKFHTNQRSNGTDTVEQYVQAIAEPYLPTYTCTINIAISAATANSHLFQLMAGASLRVGIRRILVTQSANGTTGQQIWELRRLTTAGSGGTAATPAPLDPADTAAGATFQTLPSSKGTECTLIHAQNVLTHATVATVDLNPLLDLDFTRERTKALWIAAGTSNGICLKAQTGSTSTTVLMTVYFVESPEGA